MLEVSTLVSSSDVAELDRTLRRVQAETRKSSVGAVLWASRRVARAGADIAKPGKKLRRQRTVRPRGARLGKVQMEVYTQKSTTPKWVTIGLSKNIGKAHGGGQLALADAQHLRQREIERRGLARQVWKVIGGKIGSSFGASGAGRGARRTAYENARVRKKLTSIDPSITIHNKLTYVEDAFPGITSEALRKGTKELNDQLNRRLSRAIEGGR